MELAGGAAPPFPLLLTITVPLIVRVPTRGASRGIVLVGALAASSLNASKVLSPSLGLFQLARITKMGERTYALTLPTIPT